MYPNRHTTSPNRLTGLKRLAVAGVVTVALAGAAFVAAQAGGGKAAPVDADDPMHVVEDENLVYTYDAISGQEALFDRGADPHLRRNLAPARTPDVERMRKRLLARERAETLEQVREPHLESIARLRALGYM